ncbi:hypothetical protein VULLAG_LOCUS15712 [Vulpes lagopus]
MERDDIYLHVHCLTPGEATAERVPLKGCCFLGSSHFLHAPPLSMNIAMTAAYASHTLRRGAVPAQSQLPPKPGRSVGCGGAATLELSVSRF